MKKFKVLLLTAAISGGTFVSMDMALARNPELLKQALQQSSMEHEKVKRSYRSNFDSSRSAGRNGHQIPQQMEAVTSETEDSVMMALDRPSLSGKSPFGPLDDEIRSYNEAPKAIR